MKQLFQAVKSFLWISGILLFLPEPCFSQKFSVIQGRNGWFGVYNHLTHDTIFQPEYQEVKIIRDSIFLLTTDRVRSSYPANRHDPYTPAFDRTCIVSQNIWVGTADKIIHNRTGYFQVEYIENTDFAVCTRRRAPSTHCPEGENQFWFGVVNSQGKEVLPPLYAKIEYFEKDFFIASGEHSTVLVNSEGKSLTKQPYKTIKRISFSTGFAGDLGPVRFISENQFNHFGLLGEHGEVRLPCKFTSIGNFYDSVAVVKQGNKSGVVDYNGRVVVHPKYDELRNFWHGYSSFRIGEKWGMVNTHGEEVIPAAYEGVLNLFRTGYFYFSDKGKTGILDLHNHVVLEGEYGSVIYSGIKDVFWIQTKAPASYDPQFTFDYALFNAATEKFITDFKFKDWGYFNGPFAVVRNQLVSKSGETTDIPGMKTISKCASNIWTVKKLEGDLEKYAFFDSTGKQLTDFVFEYIQPPLDNKIRAFYQGSFIVLDENLNVEEWKGTGKPDFILDE